MNLNTMRNEIINIECNYCGENIKSNIYLSHIRNCSSNYCNEYFNDYYSDELNNNDAVENLHSRDTNRKFTENEIDRINLELQDTGIIFNEDDSELIIDGEVSNIIDNILEDDDDDEEDSEDDQDEQNNINNIEYEIALERLTIDANLRNRNQNINRENILELFREFNNSLEIGIGLSNIKNYSEPTILSENTDCSICLYDYEKGVEFNKMLCNHCFCKECSLKWFNNNVKCPLCNRDLRQFKKNNNGNKL
jgi:hypothetical protein